MATKKKLNVKFLAIVLGAVGLGLAVVGGIVVMQYRNDPVKHIQSGDDLMAEGLPDKAVQQYLRGIGKAPFEMAYYDKAIEAIDSIRPETEFDALEEFNRLIGVLIAKAEKASPQDGKDAETVRAEALERVLDDVRVFVFTRELVELSDRDSAYAALGRRFQLLDAAMSRVAGVDPRLAAAVRGMTVEAAWRAASLQTESQWAASAKRIRQAIAIDPTYVPNWYGLLRGQLDRFEIRLIESGPRAAAALLKGDEGLLATLEQAREAVGEAPAPEIDMIEAELGQVALFAGAAGEGPDALIPVPSGTGLEAIVQSIRDLSTLRLWEARIRLEEIRASGLRVLRRSPSARTESAVIAAYQEQAVELLTGMTEAFMEIAPRDPRTIALRLATISGRESEDERIELEAAIADVLALEVDRVGTTALMASALRRQAALKNFDLTISPGIESIRNQQPIDPEVKARVEAAVEAVEKAFADVTASSISTEILKVRLVHDTFLGVDARLRGDSDSAAGHFRDGSRAASQLRATNDRMLDGRTLDAALILARERGEFGEALALLNGAIESNPEIAEDLDLRIGFVALLGQAGRVEDAAAMISDIRGRAAAESNSIVLARLADLETSLARMAQGVDLSDVRGADLLAAESEASLRGDIDERRRLLDQVIGDSEVLPAIRAKALLRRAGIEAQEGEFGIARQFAERVLELDPGNPMAMLIMNSDADTGIIDRYRILAENASDGDEGRDVAMAGMIRRQLLADTIIEADERAELEGELSRLLSALATRPEPSVDTVRFLAGIALDEGRISDAGAYAKRLVEIEAEPTSLSVLLRARVLRESGDPDGAIALVRDAIEVSGLGTDGMYVLLGELLALRGDREGSTEAYRMAVELAPSRPLNALRLAATLLAEGRAAEALPVLRAARNEGRESPAFLDSWLLQEVRAGNHGVAIRERLRRYEFAPIDFRNAIALVALLAESPIGRTDVVWTKDEAAGRRGAVAGEPRFDEAAWSRLSPSERQAVVMDVRRRRLAEASAIIDRMVELDGTNPQVVTAASAFLRSQPGDENAKAAGMIVDQAIKALRDSLAEDLTDSDRLVAETRLSRVLAVKAEQALAAGRPQDRQAAADLLAEAVELEGDRSSDIETIAASLYIRNQMLAEAVPHQRRLLEEREAAGLPTSELKEIARRLVEILVSVNDVEAASPIVDRYFRSDDPSAADLSSLGAFTLGRADQARRNRAEGDWAFLSLYDEADAYYDRAAALQANDPQIDFARLKVAENRWRWSDDGERPARYADLRNAAAGFVARHADSWVARRELVSVLLQPDADEGSTVDTQERRFKEAMVQLREFLELEPAHVEARLFLIERLRQAGEERAALDVAQAALDRNPTDQIWAAQVGRLRTELREFEEAARQFGMLFEQTGDESYLQYQVMALMEQDPPRADAVIGLARANGQIFARRPFLGGMYAAAMAQTGRRELALRNFESLYTSVRQRHSDEPMKQRQEMSRLSPALPQLFVRDESGVSDLEAYLDTISGGNPTVTDLLNVAAVWQEILDDNDASPAPDDEVGNRALEAMIALLRRATTVDPDHPETASAYLRLGILLRQGADCSGAIEAFEQAAELQPNSSQALNNLAFLLLECDGDLERALDLAEKAVVRMAASPENRDTLGAILQKLASRTEDPEARAALQQQARDQLRQSTRLGRSPMPWIRLAELELEAGRLPEARNALLKAGDLDPDASQQARLDALTERLGTSP